MSDYTLVRAALLTTNFNEISPGHCTSIGSLLSYDLWRSRHNASTSFREARAPRDRRSTVRAMTSNPKCPASHDPRSTTTHVPPVENPPVAFKRRPSVRFPSVRPSGGASDAWRAWRRAYREIRTVVVADGSCVRIDNLFNLGAIKRVKYQSNAFQTSMQLYWACEIISKTKRCLRSVYLTALTVQWFLVEMYRMIIQLKCDAIKKI